ncbi:MAG: VWA domain-containing protein [Alphaproteobacteria bacterium]|nr:VWA domain-containing protein [Alphaproteobacteria bacterium]
MTRFLYPEAFILLVLPFVIFWFLPRVKGLHGDALRIPFLNDLKNINNKATKLYVPLLSQKALFSLKFLYLFILWALLVTAAARPQYAGEPFHVKAENRDIMLVVDISNSMLQPDFSTKTHRIDRMSAVKAVVSAFIEKRTEDRVGLILFGTLAYLQSPLTFDKKSVKEILLNTDAGMAGESTSIGDALGIALKNLKDEKQKQNKVIILLTDGENNDGSLSMAQAIDLAEKEGIKIYTIGVGGQGSFMAALFNLRNNELDEASLKELAKKTRGNYFRAKDLNSLAEIYRRIDALEPQNEEGSVIQEIREYFYIPLLIALVLLALLIFLPRSYVK